MFAQFSALTLLQPIVRRCLQAAFVCVLGVLFCVSAVVQAQLLMPHLVKDINTATANSKPEYFTGVGSVLFFVADDGIHGRELWKTDGNENSTVLVKDINPGSSSSEPEELFNFNGTLFFSTTDSNNGCEL